MEAKRLLFAALSGGIACALGWWILAGRHAPPVEISRRDPQLDALLARGEATRSMVSGRGPFELEPIDESVARALFVMHSPDLRWIPGRYYGYVPGLRQEIEWEEHPDGRWRRVTNAQGLRRDDDRGLADGGLRVLVTGDSHTDGVCNNGEGFPSLLETSLAARSPEREVVVLNTGVVGYSFYNYLGALEDFLPERPDVFVIAVYGGNDFLEVLRPHHYFRGTQVPPTRPGYWDRIEAAKRVSSSALAQGLNQVLYFQEHPEQLEVVQEATSVLIRRIRERCEQQGVQLVVAYIPPAFEAPWPALVEMQARAEEVLDLAPADFEVAATLARHLFDELDQLGVSRIDMGPIYRAASSPCYWKRDLHINLEGQRRIAEAVEQAILSGSGQLAPLELAPPPDGPFQKRFPTGELEAEGRYANGLQEGEWSYYHKGGALRARGSWAAGLRDGEWRWWYADGTPQKEGRNVAGKPDGVWKEWYRDGGPRLVASWSMGVPHGPWQQWHPGGQLSCDSSRKSGRMDGSFKTWYASGQIEQELDYQDGELTGAGRRWHPSGDPAWSGQFVDGLRSGHFRYWDEQGRRKSEGEFVAGKREGPSTFWREDGSVDASRTGLYHDGELARRNSPPEALKKGAEEG